MQRTETLHVEVKVVDWMDEVRLGLRSNYRSWEDSLYDDRLMLVVTMPDGKVRHGDELSLMCAIDPAGHCGQWRIELSAHWDDEFYRQYQVVDIVAVATTDWGEKAARFEVGTLHDDNGWGDSWSFDVVLTCDVVSDELCDIAENFGMALSFAS